MNIKDLLIGKKVRIVTDMKTIAELEIAEIIDVPHHQQITPDTRENDWWGESKDWTTYLVKFTNGGQKAYESLQSIEIIN
jgi:hypothetical protein